MEDRIFRDREKAFEEKYFREKDAKLLETMRQRAKLDEVAVALAEHLSVDNPDLLLHVRTLGVTRDTAAAFLLAPLVQVAWAEGSVQSEEAKTVLRLAQERGVEEGSAAYMQLSEWLRERPDDALFDAAVEVIKHGLSVLPRKEKAERIGQIVNSCREVAKASGSKFARLIGLSDGISSSEASVLDTIKEHLRANR